MRGWNTSRRRGVRSWTLASSGVDARNENTFLGANVGNRYLRYAGRFRVYELKIWQDGVLMRNFVPMRLGGENGMPALWDRVSAKPFFLNDKAPFARVGPVVGKNPSGFLILFR